MTKLKDEDRQEEMEEVDLQEWTSSWSQIMTQLRQGIKLKKVEYSKTPTEFALTPYEMLMDDIRSRRIKLHHVEPQRMRSVSSDTRDQILEFIRSRPPLRPVSQRVLQPRRRKESSARELILETIRDGSGKQKLKKIERKPSKNNILEDIRRKRRVAVIAEETPVTLDDVSQATIAARRSSRTNNPISSQSRPSQKKSSFNKEASSSSEKPKMRRKTVASNSLRPNTFLQDKYKTSLCFLNLSLSELSHIRAEISRAEMEDRNLPPGLMSDVLGKGSFIIINSRL